MVDKVIVCDTSGRESPPSLAEDLSIRRFVTQNGSVLTVFPFQAPPSLPAPKIFRCQFCEITFKSVHETSNHIKTIHLEPQEETFVEVQSITFVAGFPSTTCKSCGISFLSFNLLRSHCSSLHNDRKNIFSCVKCNNDFSSFDRFAFYSCKFKNFIPFYKPFRCNVCDDAFRTRLIHRNLINAEFKKFQLKWKNCIAFGADNTNSTAGRNKGVLGLFKMKQSNLKFIGCPCNLTHLAAQKATNSLAVDVESEANDHPTPVDFLHRTRMLLAELMFVMCGNANYEPDDDIILESTQIISQTNEDCLDLVIEEPSWIAQKHRKIGMIWSSTVPPTWQATFQKNLFRKSTLNSANQIYISNAATATNILLSFKELERSPTTTRRIQLCMDMNMIAKEYVCPACGEKMVLTERDGSDGYSWFVQSLVRMLIMLEGP
ncbi:hypothetical protein AVEN_246266-1 [Araneus ventricosus]|uniref:C2H2-type domain-containing protein n=1 Tax=Araneus ventricosus TaxID=182803 RepID=A0A4Y2LCF1_ARAVE|nr:hypothetical protein AVEN_246266-1 [Araneus ventricosus]